MSLSQSIYYKEFSTLPIYRKLYLIGLSILAFGMPLSPILVSVSQFILFGTWLLEGEFKIKIGWIKSNKILWAFLLLPLLHLLWLINSTEFHYALHDIKIKIPLLIFPLVLGTITPLSAKELRFVLNTFILGVFIGTCASFAVLTNIYPIAHNDIRAISIFISHIRFGLMILLSLVIVGYYFIITFPKLALIRKISIILLIIWFLTFLIILQSITSWVILIVLIFFAYAAGYKKIHYLYFKISIKATLIIFLLISLGIVSKVYYDFYFTKNQPFTSLPEVTPYGNKYLNDTTSTYKENGHYINVLICQKELAETWPKLSKIPFNESDANGYPIGNTMIRYLASKGLPKDKNGLLTLDNEDIKMIENGYASCVYRKKFIPYVKTYNVIWEIDRYLKSGDANNKTIVQRIEFSHAAIYIIKNNFWFGVGTGDLSVAYEKAYREINSNLNQKNQLRAHNQFITFFVTFGIFGFLAALISMFYPILKNGKNGGFLLSSFLILVFISMLNEDTLETQAGVTFYIAFYTLFIFSKKEYND